MPIDPTILTAGIAATAQLGAQGANAYAQGKTNRKSREFSKEMYERQKADALVNWERQNEYNSPKNQMQRLKDAKLNPHLIYGNGAVGNSASGIETARPGSYSPTAPKFDSSAVTGAVDAYTKVRNSGVVTDNLALQNKLLNKEMHLKDAQILDTLTGARQKTTSADRAEFDLAIEKQLQETSIQAREAALDKTLTETKTMKDRNEREAVMNAQNVEESLARIAKMQVEAGKIPYDIAEINQRIENMKKDGTIKDFEIKMNKLGLTKGDNIWFRNLIQLFNKAFPSGDTRDMSNPAGGHPKQGGW